MSAPAVAVSADGKKRALAWKDMRTGEPNVFWTISQTADFGQEFQVHHSAAGKQDHPSLTIDRHGRTWVAWEHRHENRQQVFVRSAMTAGEPNQKGLNQEGKNPEIPISDLSESPASYPVLASGREFVAVVYESGQGEHKSIKFRRIAHLRDTANP